MHDLNGQQRAAGDPRPGTSGMTAPATISSVCRAGRTLESSRGSSVVSRPPRMEAAMPRLRKRAMKVSISWTSRATTPAAAMESRSAPNSSAKPAAHRKAAGRHHIPAKLPGWHSISRRRARAWLQSSFPAAARRETWLTSSTRVRFRFSLRTRRTLVTGSPSSFL